MRAITALFILIVGACVTPQAAPDPYAYVAEPLAPRVTLMRQGEPFHVQPRGNVTIIRQSRGVVLIDSGGSPAAAEEVIREVRRQTSLPVTSIVLTHWHGDHVLGVSRLLREWPEARVISSTATQAHLADPRTDRFMPGNDAEANARYAANIAGGVAYLRAQAEDASLSAETRGHYAQAAQEYERFGAEIVGAHRVAPTLAIESALDLGDRDTPVEIRFLGRANTDCDLIAWLPKQHVLITGDIVVSPIPYGYGSYPQSWIGVIDQLEAYPFAVLAPGHGAPMRNRVYLDALKAMLEKVRTQVGAIADEVDTPEQALARVDLSAERAAFSHSDAWLAQWFDAYWAQPIVASALKEAKGQEIVQGE